MPVRTRLLPRNNLYALAARIAQSSNKHDRILQRADAADADADNVGRLQSEIVRGHDAGAGEQHDAMRKLLTLEEISAQFVKPALDLANGSLALKDHFVAALHT